MYCYSTVNSTTNTNFSVHNYKKSTIDMKILFPDMKIKYTTDNSPRKKDFLNIFTEQCHIIQKIYGTVTNHKFEMLLK